MEAQFATLTNLKPLSIVDASMIALVDEIGASNGVLEFEFTVNGSTPAGGRIQLEVPLWNPHAPILHQKTLFTVQAPQCKGIENMSESLPCQLDSETNR